jgi:hypothetical protein
LKKWESDAASPPTTVDLKGSTFIPFAEEEVDSVEVKKIAGPHYSR